LPHHNGQAGNAFAANDANLDARLARTICDHEGKTRLNEIDMIDASIATLQVTIDGKIDRLQVGSSNAKSAAESRDRIRFDDTGHSLARLSANCQGRRPI